jgi:transcription termination/antitermination protein NusA
MQTPRTEFAQALRAIATERGLDPDVILDTIQQAIVAAYKRDARDRGEEAEEFEYEVELDSTNGEARIYSWPLEKPEERKDVTPPGFGRIAAQTAKQVIHQKIREAEKGAIMDEYTHRVGSLISGMILRFDGPDVRVDLGKTEGIMTADERVPNERLNPNQRLTFLMKDIIDTPKGKQIILSRADANFVSKLFAREVPEISSGSVEIKLISREAGVRTKLAVASSQSGVDPVGSCVGQKGVRVQAVTNELGGERIDIIPYNENMQELIKASLSPAEGVSVSLDEKTKTAKVKAPEDMLSLAIGKDGQNARLAAKLTGWKIEVKSNGEVVGSKDKKEEGEEKPAAKVQEVDSGEKQGEEVEGGVAKESKGDKATAEEESDVKDKKVKADGKTAPTEAEKIEKKEQVSEDTQVIADDTATDDSIQKTDVDINEEEEVKNEVSGKLEPAEVVDATTDEKSKDVAVTSDKAADKPSESA